MKKVPLTVPLLLGEARETYLKRNKAYGDSYKRFGTIMANLFPDGFHPVTPDEWNRLGLLTMMVTKLVRHTNSKLTHVDSMHDLGVYAFMMEELLRARSEERRVGKECRS